MSDTCFAPKAAVRLLLAVCLLLALGACGGSGSDTLKVTEDGRSPAAPAQQSFGLPSPGQILKGLSFSDDDLLVNGADSAFTPAPQNAGELETDMVFSPSFVASAAQFSGLAFAVYGFQ